MPELSEVTFIEVDMRPLLTTKSLLQDFLKEMDKYKLHIHEREANEARRIEEKATSMNERLRQKQLKLMMSEPWPVDTELKDLKNCNKDENFPSLSATASLN